MLNSVRKSGLRVLEFSVVWLQPLAAPTIIAASGPRSSRAAMSTTYDTDMFDPLAIGNCTLKAEVSDESRTRKISGTIGVHAAPLTNTANVSAPSAMTVRMYHRARGGRSESKYLKYTGLTPLKRLFDTIVWLIDMKRLRPLIVLAILAAAGYGAYRYANRPPTSIVLTGIVTTNDVIISPQIAGQISQLLVKEGDVVKRDQLVALLRPDELKAETAYYAQNVEGLSSQVKESEAALRFQQRQMGDQIAQAESTLASTEAQAKATVADLEQARVTFTRTQNLSQ